MAVTCTAMDIDFDLLRKIKEHPAFKEHQH